MNPARLARLFREIADELERDERAPSVAKAKAPRRRRTPVVRPRAPVTEEAIREMRQLCAKRGIPV